jgi:hypothetical protein
VSGLAHDGQLAWHHSNTPGVASRASQGMAGVLGGIEVGRFRCSIYDQAHGIFVEANRPHASWRSTRNSAPSEIPAAGFQAVSARTGQVDGVDP